MTKVSAIRSRYQGCHSGIAVTVNVTVSAVAVAAVAVATLLSMAVLNLTRTEC